MTPAYRDALTDLYLGDCTEALRGLPAESVHCVVTSPPYWGGIRSYRGLGAGQLGHEATPEEYVERIVGIMREVRRVLRDDGTLWLNLGDVYTGGGGFYPNAPSNLKGSIQGQRNALGLANEKTERLDGGVGDGQLAGIPFRVVLALQADGWCWRDTVIWHKLAPMPESVSGTFWEKHRVKAQAGNLHSGGAETGKNLWPSGSAGFPVAQWTDCPGCPTCAPNDGLVLRRGQGRTTKAHEYLFLLAKGEKYYYDMEAVKEPAIHEGRLVKASGPNAKNVGVFGEGVHSLHSGFTKHDTLVTDRNRRSVWSLPPEPQGDALCAGCRTYYGARPKGKCPRCGGADFVSHYAAFVSGLVEPCILAGTSARGCCQKCGAPWARVVNKRPSTMNIRVRDAAKGRIEQKWGEYAKASEQEAESYGEEREGESTTLGWRATCRCDTGEPVPCTVLDCFAGSGTTSIVARRLGRRSIGVELAPDYMELSSHRLRAAQPGMALGV